MIEWIECRHATRTSSCVRFCRLHGLVGRDYCSSCPDGGKLHIAPQFIPSSECSNRGGVAVKAKCRTCGGERTIEVNACSLHGTCVKSQVDSSRLTFSPRPKVCQLCRDRRPPCYDQLAILTPHFNPCGYTRLKETWWEWVETLGPLRDRLTTIELVYDWQDGPETDADIVLHGDGRHFLWQKEALLNIGLRSLPPEIKYVAWIDHDAVFENPHWAEHACQLIDSHADVVQLWDRVDFTGPNGDVISSNPSSACEWKQKNSRSGSPGLAWMASREYLDRIGGLYAHNVVGGGDQFAFEAWTQDSWFMDTLTSHERELSSDWIKGAREQFRGMLYVPGVVAHLFHGTRQDRQYVSRIDILKKHDFDPSADVLINNDGLLEWCGNKPQFAKDVRDYFCNRNEDANVAALR